MTALTITPCCAKLLNLYSRKIKERTASYNIKYLVEKVDQICIWYNLTKIPGCNYVLLSFHTLIFYPNWFVHHLLMSILRIRMPIKWRRSCYLNKCMHVTLVKIDLFNSHYRGPFLFQEVWTLNTEHWILKPFKVNFNNLGPAHYERQLGESDFDWNLELGRQKELPAGKCKRTVRHVLLVS